MAGKSPQPSHEPPFQAKGTLRADAARSERERGAQGWGKPWPELPKSRGTLEGRLGKEKDTEEIPVKREGLLPPRWY